jgi:LuxR family transcriptional regulator, maltose regulon positive regulatory protein
MTRDTAGLPLPRAERPMLVRTRLLDRLRGRWFTRVTVVTAPAGYGKTTLLTQAIDANRSVPLGVDCWLACESAAGGAPGSATVLGAALCQAVGAARPLGPAGTVTDAGGVVTAAVTAVSEAVWRRSPDHVALIIDDAHEIPAGSEAAALVTALVDALPANGHLVLAGRLPPPVPLARLEVEGRVLRLDECDLAFTGEELVEFAALRAVDLERVVVSDGWPALAELSASASVGAGGRGVTAEYLGQEILAPLDAVRRRYLAILAHLGPFDDELARAALDGPVDVDGLLAGIPLVTATGPGGVRGLHPLWRSALASEVDEAVLGASRRRAARVLARRGEPDKAVSMLIDAGAWDELGAVLVVLLGAAHAFVHRDVLAGWFARLPEEAQQGPHGRLLRAVLTVEVDPAGAWDQLEACAAAFRSAGSLAGEAACLAQLARLAWWSDESDRLAELAVRASALADEGCEEAAALACLGRALVLDLQNDCRQLLAELDRIPPGSLSQAWQGVVAWLRSMALLQLGDTDLALTAAEHAVAHTGDLHAPMAEGTRLQALWYGGRTGEALDAVPRQLERLEAIGHRGHIAVGAAQCSVAYSLAGERDRAAACLARACAAAASREAPLIDTNVSLAEAALAVETGDEATARVVLAASLGRHRLGEGLSAGSHLRNLPLIYVLVPETRAHWERADLGPAFVTARSLARAVAGVRDSRRLPADTPALPATGLVQAHLPLRWIAELAVAAVDAGRADGWRLLEETWPATRPTVVDLAGRAGDRLSGAARDVLGHLPVPPTSRYRLRLLGPIELRRDGVLVETPEWRRERVRAMLAHLVVHGTVSRERLAEDLWPERDPDVQSRNLRVTLTYLLRVLEPDRGPRDVSFFVRQHGGNLTLHPGEWLRVDAWDLDTACQQAAEADDRGEPAAALDRGLQAAEIWGSEPTDLAAEPWALPSVERWRRRFTAAATRAGELLLAHGHSHRALALAERALDADPWLERAHRLVVAAHHANHDELAARRAVSRYRDTVSELGIGHDEAALMAQRLLGEAPKL